MRKRFILILSAILVLFITYGKQVNIDAARAVGIRFYKERMHRFENRSPENIRVIESLTREADGKTVYFIFNLEPAGFVVVSAEDAVMPVLAYSFEGRFSFNDNPAQCAAWMKQYEDEITYARRRQLTAPVQIQRIWEEYTAETPSPIRPSAPVKGKAGSGMAVAPLITSNWDQGFPYNEQCPPDAAGPGGHTLVGCVPVCMGQIMYYYRWPDTGTGTYSYYDSTYGTISANFGATSYQWSNMTNTAKSSTPGLAELLFHLGVSCDLVYGPSSSGMYNHKAAYALRTFFKYSPQTQYIFRDSTTLNWDSILIAHLDRRMPLYYAGWSVPNVAGHAFVCDGYQDTAYFHFNFGWSGSSNGYFYTNNLIAGGNNFQLAQEVIVNIYPDTALYSYPAYCSGSNRLTTFSGSIEDGSGPMMNYAPHANCSWLLDPQPEKDSVSSITLTFNGIKTNPGDLVTVYDGGSADAPVLGSFSGDTLPPAVTGTKNRMFIAFHSDMGPCAAGWSAEYKSKIPAWCTGNTTIIADTAIVTDGSFDFDYHNSSTCKWVLETPDSTPLTIHFRSFDTEKDKDFLSFYDIGSNQKLTQVSGHYTAGSLPDSVTAQSGRMMMVFMTNNSITGEGWEIYYPQTHLGVNEIPSPETLSIIPNPASGAVNIRFTLPAPANAKVFLSDMMGTRCELMAVAGKRGINEARADVSGHPAGVYLLQVRTDQLLLVRKLIVR